MFLHLCRDCLNAKVDTSQRWGEDRGALGFSTCHAELWGHLTLDLGSTFRSFLDLKGQGCGGKGWGSGMGPRFCKSRKQNCRVWSCPDVARALGLLGQCLRNQQGPQCQEWQAHSVSLLGKVQLGSVSDFSGGRCREKRLPPHS